MNLKALSSEELRALLLRNSEEAHAGIKTTEEALQLAKTIKSEVLHRIKSTMTRMGV